MLEIVRHRSERHHWQYAVTLAVLVYFALLGAHEGYGAIAYLLCLAIVGVLQMVRPSVLGWATLMVFFGGYVVSLFAVGSRQPVGDFVVFLSLGSVAAIALLHARPRGNDVDRSAVWIALCLATVLLSPVFIPTFLRR